MFQTPTPKTWLKSTAVHLQFVRQYAPHLYRHTFLASKLRRKGNPEVRLPFVLQYASHLYGSTPPICTAVLLEKLLGVGVTGTFSELGQGKKPINKQTHKQTFHVIVPGLSRDCTGTLPAFSWDFLGILFMCFPFSPGKRETHKQFDPHPFPG